MKVSRRQLAQVLAGAAAATQTAPAQAPPAADADLNAARAQLRNSATTVARVALPMAVEPAARFAPKK